MTEKKRVAEQNKAANELAEAFHEHQVSLDRDPDNMLSRGLFFAAMMDALQRWRLLQPQDPKEEVK